MPTPDRQEARSAASAATVERYRIDGTPISNTIQGDRCYECGMALCDPREYHPWEACEEFTRSHDSTKVWRLLRPLLTLWLEERRVSA